MPDGTSDAIVGPFECVDRAVKILRQAVDSLDPDRSTPRPIPSLLRGGLVLVTEDDSGVARAVVADLKALGHPVIRVRHGVGDGPVEGVNLTSVAAVAALIERVRSRGQLAAIVHTAPLRCETNRQKSWDEPDDARTLALLAQASAEDLKASACRGGSCLVVAHPRPEGDPTQVARLDRWVEISARSLKGVRVRALSFEAGGEREVIAAEIVRAVLGSDEPRPVAGHVGPNRGECRAILLGAPDRASWIHLASALVDWLEDSPGVRVTDLAYTLNRDQPLFPFRVGLVADSGTDLSARLRRTVSELANPDCRSIHDLSGAYWSDPDPRPVSIPRPKTEPVFRGHHRLRGLPALSKAASLVDAPTLESLLERSARQWLTHEIALKFARDGSANLEFIADESAQLLDLSLPHRESFQSSTIASISRQSLESQVVVEALDALDVAIQLRRELLRRICEV